MRMSEQGGRLSELQARTLENTRQFWNLSPCGAQESFVARVEHRYRMEPWIPVQLKAIAARHHDILEVGCGQGTDGLVLCSLLRDGATYLGLDDRTRAWTLRARAAAKRGPPSG